MELVGSDLMMYGNERDYLTTRVAYKLGLNGPAINVSTACSTSLVAICQACQSLLMFQCDMALAGGVSVTVPQKRGSYHDEGNIGSSDGHTRSFDSVKTNIGHLDVAAGAAGLIKTALSLHDKIIPASLHFTRPNPKLDLEDSPFYVNATLREWKARPGVPRRAGVSSFGTGGTN